MRILYISQYFPPEMGAPSARVYELSKRWVQRGQQVTVLTGFPHHPTGNIPSHYKQHIFKRETTDGIKVVRTYVFPAANKGFLKRIASYLSFMFSSIFLGTWNVGKPDLIIATSPQFFVAIAGYIISKIKHRPFVLEIRDFWPESIIQLGQLKNKIILNILKMIELFLYQHAKLIVVVADSSVSILNNKGIPSSKIIVIKNGVDLELFDARKRNTDLKNKLKLDNKFIVSYIGTLGLSHALDQVIHSASILRNQSDIHFLFIGEGAEKNNLLTLAKENGLSNITFLDQIDKQNLPYYYSLSDVVLVTLRKLELFSCVIPSKIFEIMAMAKPILLSVDGEARKLVIDEANAGIFVEPENSREMAQKILELYSNQKWRQKLGENGLNFVQLNYNRIHLADKYLDYLLHVK